MTYTKYQEKYRLNETSHFDHKAFVADFEQDVILMSDGYTHQYVGWTVDTMDDFVSGIKKKFNSIFHDTKVPAQAQSKLWGFIFATVVSKFRDREYPEYKENKQRQKYWNDPFAGMWNRQGSGGFDTKRPFENYNFDDLFRRFRESMFGEQFRNSQKSYWNSFGRSSFSSPSIDSNDLQLLDITRENLTVEVLKKQFRIKAMECHPDHDGGDQARFVKIAEAKDRLEAYLKNQAR